MEYFGYILLSLVVLLFMVLIHELGHYTAAKILGFTIEEFSIGFGPKIFGKRRKNGELFSIRLLPLGGYCAFLGESDEEEESKQKGETSAECNNVNASSDENVCGEKTDTESGAAEVSKDEDLLSYVMRAKIDEDKVAEEAAKALEQKPEKVVRLDKNGDPVLTYNQQKPWKRIIVLLGGVVFNFVSAIIFSLIYIWSVGYAAPEILSVNYDAEAGATYSMLQAGDIITAVNGEDITVMDSYGDLMEGVTGDAVNFSVLRGGEVVSVDLTRKEIKYDKDGKLICDKDGNPAPYTGFGFTSSTTFIGANADNAFTYCVPYTFKLSWSILGSFGKLITGQVPINSMSGPVGSIKLMADVSIADWRNILILLPLLASNLAIFNLLPFPALDGARVIFTTVEWIRRKPNNRKVEGIVNFVGLAVLLLFVLIVDILSFAL